MNQQLPLAVSLPPEATLSDFVAGANLQPLDALQRVAHGKTSEPLYLSGPPGAGKTHLLMGATALAQQLGRGSSYLPLSQLAAFSPELLLGLDELDLIALDDVQAIVGNPVWEQALFRLFNRARDCRTSLIFGADRGPTSLDLTLPDLKSRLAWGISYRLQPLDDQGRITLLLHHARQRGLEMTPAVARWIVSRCSRGPGDLLELLARLDEASLAEKRKLTLPFVQAHL